MVLLRIQVFLDVMCHWVSVSQRFQGTLILPNIGTILPMTRHYFTENLNFYQEIMNRIALLCSQIGNAE